MRIISQKITKRVGRKWHPDKKFNMVGEHTTRIDLAGKTVEKVFTVRSIPTSCTVVFTDGTTFNFPVANTAWYLEAEHTVEGDILNVIIPLGWYTLSSEYYFITT